MGAHFISELDSHEQAVNWHGHSGRRYALTSENFDSFSLRDGVLYLLVTNGVANWVGGARDLIEDAASRANFRKAMAHCSSVLRLDARLDDTNRDTTAWDLAHGHAVTQPHLIAV